jgi:hypothetical protein
MQVIRRTLRNLLTWAAVLALLSAYPLGSYASPAPLPEPITPATMPHVDDPSTGEPDVGATRGQQTNVSSRSAPERAQYLGYTVRMLGWSTVVWLRTYLGIGIGR